MTINEFSVFTLSIELLLACLAAIVVSIICMDDIFKHKNEPPCLGYWKPWIGCALEFGKEPLYFIERARRKVSCFSLYSCYIYL